MPKHVQQTHLFTETFDVATDEEVSVKSITDSERNVKVTANPDNVEFQVTDSVDLEITSEGDFDFKKEGQGVSFSNGEKLTGESLQQLESAVNTLQNTAFNSGRSFIRFNDGFTINNTNISLYEDKNIIYTAKNDKPLDSPTRPDVFLPTDADIAASGESYPIVFEFTHLGGTARLEDSNLVRLFFGGNIISTLHRDEVAIVIKDAVGEDYQVQNSTFDPNDTILPNGVFNLKTETTIDNISTIGTELGGITIVAGDSFLVQVGGSWSGYTVTDDSVLVALVNNPSLVDSTSNDDWLLLDNPRVNATAAALLTNFVQDGVTFNANRNIKIDPSNVTEFNAVATGTPITRQLGTNTQGNNSQIRYDNVPIQFSDLVGGNLEILISVDTTSSSGFVLDPVELQLYYSADVIFTFPLTTVELDGGQYRLRITIPNDDYSSILNTDVSLRFIYNFNGASWFGTYTIDAVMNSAIGTLHDPIVTIAQREALNVSQSLSTRIDQLIGDVDQENRSLEAISDRISPYKDVTITTPEINTRYLDSTGSDAFPSTVSSMLEVSVSNPRFTGGDVALYIAVIGGGNYALKNITKDTILNIDDSEATVDLGESLLFEGNSYFVYRVTGLTANEVYEVERVSSERVIAWQDDIDNLEDDIGRIDAELEHAVLGLPDEVVQVLENEVSVTEESSPSIKPTPYNNGFSSNGNQVVFYESNPNTASGGVLSSKPINETSGARERRKLIYFPSSQAYNNQAYISAFDGTTGIDLIRYENGVFNAQIFVPSIPAGSTTNTVYPAQSTLVSGNGIWQTIPALTFQNGVPVPEADEIFFTRNIPSTSTTLNIQYRGHANGNIFGTSSTTLVGVGGSNEVATSFTLDDGGEQSIVEVRWYPSRRQIRVSETTRLSTGLPTINDVQVILSFDETRVVPATPDTTRQVAIENVHEGAQVFAIKPSSGGNLILVGDRTEIDTGFAYTTLFGASETGHLIAGSQDATFLDYENIDIISSTVTDLENHASLPQFGLFTTEYTHDTVVTLDTQLRAHNSQGDVVNLAEEVILVASDNTRWKIEVSPTGVLSTTEIT